MKTTLVVMAAGMGSRFGGLKQAEPITTDGKGILDFSVHDAKAAGFEKAVFWSARIWRRISSASSEIVLQRR